MDITIDGKQIVYNDEDESKITGCVYFLNGYPAMKTKQGGRWQHVYLHRLFTGARDSQRVRFLNGNRYDLRRSNLAVSNG